MFKIQDKLLCSKPQDKSLRSPCLQRYECSLVARRQSGSPNSAQNSCLRTEPPRFGFPHGRNLCGADAELRPNGAHLDLVASSLQESTFNGGCRGLIVQQCVPPNTIYKKVLRELIERDKGKQRGAKLFSSVCYNFCPLILHLT